MPHDPLLSDSRRIEATTLEDYRRMSDDDHRARIASEYAGTGKGADPVVAEYGTVES